MCIIYQIYRVESDRNAKMERERDTWFHSKTTSSFYTLILYILARSIGFTIYKICIRMSQIYQSRWQPLSQKLCRIHKRFSAFILFTISLKRRKKKKKMSHASNNFQWFNTAWKPLTIIDRTISRLKYLVVSNICFVWCVLMCQVKKRNKGEANLIFYCCHSINHLKRHETSFTFHD